MLSSPWDVILTALFALTGVWCAVDLLARRAQSRRADGALTEHTVVHVNHLVMSAAMILMIWVIVADIATWAQAAVFAVFVVALVPGFVAAKSAGARVSVSGHIMMNLAMIWMLLAMPLLMAGMPSGDEGSSGHHHHGGDVGAMPTSTPMWVDVVNMFFVVTSVAAALWWLAALVRGRGRHLHDLCYAAMAAGMAIMLVVMNA